MTEHRWYHTIELPDGTVTNGYADCRPARDFVKWPSAIRDGRCLDVGTFDGFWAFEMERQGAAEVMALDIDDPSQFDWAYDRRESMPHILRAEFPDPGAGFAYAASALDSTARRVIGSVYDLDPDTHGKFDVVVCGTLLLHLRDPVLALEKMRSVCKGELVLIENLDPTLDLFARWIPCARFAPEFDKWWRLNSAGLFRMVAVAGFDLTWIGRRFLVTHGPGWSGRRPGILASIAARDLTKRGGFFRACRARPRPPAGT